MGITRQSGDADGGEVGLPPHHLIEFPERQRTHAAYGSKAVLLLEAGDSRFCQRAEKRREGHPPVLHHGGLTMPRHLRCALLTISSLLAILSSAHAASYTFTQLNGPGARETMANGINDNGQIVGWYIHPSYGQQGSSRHSISLVAYALTPSGLITKGRSWDGTQIDPQILMSPISLAAFSQPPARTAISKTSDYVLVIQRGQTLSRIPLHRWSIHSGRMLTLSPSNCRSAH